MCINTSQILNGCLSTSNGSSNEVYFKYTLKSVLKCL